MGVPLALTQGDLTQKQQAFIEYACVEYVNEEREFWITLLGGKPSGGISQNSSARQIGEAKLKDPRTLKRKKIN